MQKAAKQIITVDSVLAAKQVNAKLIQGAKNKLRLCYEKDDFFSGDEEINRFAMAGVTDEELLKQEKEKKMRQLDRKALRRVEKCKLLEVVKRHRERTEKKLRDSHEKKERLLKKRKLAPDPLSEIPCSLTSAHPPSVISLPVEPLPIPSSPNRRIRPRPHPRPYPESQVTRFLDDESPVPSFIENFLSLKVLLLKMALDLDNSFLTHHNKVSLNCPLEFCERTNGQETVVHCVVHQDVGSGRKRAIDIVIRGGRQEARVCQGLCEQG